MINSTEYSPNAYEVYGQNYYVAQNAPNASDDNPGTEERPFRTISKAAAVADQGDVITIDEGIYREEVPLPRHGHPYQADSQITFRAGPGKEVYLRGSEVFEAEWEAMGDGTHRAALPDRLFQQSAYNPYERSCVIDEPRKVRPAEGPLLPETLGQVYVGGRPLAQVRSVAAVHGRTRSFVVCEDGRSIVAHFPDEEAPTGKLVELTVRERCFRPQFSGPVYIQTMGMQVEHAANPGAFSYARALAIRNNKDTGISVRRTFALPAGLGRCSSLGSVVYKGQGDSTLVSLWRDDRRTCRDDARIYTVESDDVGKTWRNVGVSKAEVDGCFLDEEHDRLIRHYLSAQDPHGAFGARGHDVLCQVSADQGQTWSAPQRIGHGSHFYRPIKLADGRLLWPYTESVVEGRYHARLGVLLGRWRPDLSGIDWEQGGQTEVSPEVSTCGLDEPAACQLPDGRIFFILRAGNVRPSQDQPGVPSVKRFCVSDDGGKTLGEAQPLTYDDGSYIYSPRAMPDAWRSSKNGRVYVILNIAGGSAENCDPRTALHLAELDPDTLCVKRGSVTIIEERHEEHDPLVRYSNWSLMEDRDTGNLVLYMKLSRSEHCIVRKGYDYSVYRYEIELPD